MFKSEIETLHPSGKLIKTGKQLKSKLQEVPETDQIY